MTFFGILKKKTITKIFEVICENIFDDVFAAR